MPVLSQKPSLASRKSEHSPASLVRVILARAGIRFAIVKFFFPLAYYFSHPETYYFPPVDLLIVILAAVTMAGSAKETHLLPAPPHAV